MDELLVPFFLETVRCGFPSPAADSREESLDFNTLLFKHKANTYCLRCSGDSMKLKGIFSGDILVVDRSIRAKSGDVIVAETGGAFTVKTLLLKEGKAILHPENPDFADIVIAEEEELVLFGVVTAVVRVIR
ncbi:translesion error-prone DNA polymerase V autoproteolytic subunit [Sphaerochaeta sp. PS]|uniref:LexA family protein n=1 Tax=Sphaerochaeta sp. PS TaxID=3076336 RepID=UPI0028A445E5|nr:translesion error-prone DNA polymerase V autoproteolytic subunit [Sphaerochaeta sp. PS]MDT4762036.1 translesion error-prone DNA polymerase V autoproteolytic subunit [Sphaerochaeta sp. PS]